MSVQVFRSARRCPELIGQALYVKIDETGQSLASIEEIQRRVNLPVSIESVVGLARSNGIATCPLSGWKWGSDPRWEYIGHRVELEHVRDADEYDPYPDLFSITEYDFVCRICGITPAVRQIGEPAAQPPVAVHPLPSCRIVDGVGFDVATGSLCPTIEPVRLIVLVTAAFTKASVRYADKHLPGYPVLLQNETDVLPWLLLKG